MTFMENAPVPQYHTAGGQNRAHAQRTGRPLVWRPTAPSVLCAAGVLVLYEFATAADENPDVIGWVPGADSVLIECKLTRADFLRDATKAVRRNPRAGMGQRRYYLCPPDVIPVSYTHL